MTGEEQCYYLTTLSRDLMYMYVAVTLYDYDIEARVSVVACTQVNRINLHVFTLVQWGRLKRTPLGPKILICYSEVSIA